MTGWFAVRAFRRASWWERLLGSPETVEQFFWLQGRSYEAVSYQLEIAAHRDHSWAYQLTSCRLPAEFVYWHRARQERLRSIGFSDRAFA